MRDEKSLPNAEARPQQPAADAVALPNTAKSASTEPVRRPVMSDLDAVIPA